jgi:hypothetical protein
MGQDAEIHHGCAGRPPVDSRCATNKGSIFRLSNGTSAAGLTPRNGAEYLYGNSKIALVLCEDGSLSLLAEEFDVRGAFLEGLDGAALHELADLSDYVWICEGRDVAGVHVVRNRSKDTAHDFS